MSKHIVISAFSARRGGGKTYLRNLLKFFSDDMDIKVTVLASKDFSLVEEREGLSVNKIAFPVQNHTLRIFWEFFILPFYLRRIKTDVFFCPGGIIPMMGYGPWKTVTMFRNMIPFDIVQRKKWPLGYMRFRNWLLARVMLRSMQNADLVIFISQFAKKVIDNVSHKRIKESIVVPHGVGDEFRFLPDNVSERPQALPREPYIVYPSIIDVYKSQFEVIQAYSLLHEDGVVLPQLLLVGEVYGKYGADVIELIKNKGLQDKIKIVGAVDYQFMPSLYHHAECVIFASQSENCPNILLEAMASASVILCSDVMPMPEFAGESVIYFNPTDPNSIADSIKKFLSNPSEFERLRELVTLNANTYCWEQTAKQTCHALVDIN